MRVLHTESSINWGGQEYRALDQMIWLRDSGHEAFLAARPGSDIAARAAAAGIPVFEMPFTGHYDLRSILTLRKVIRDNGIEIADCHGSRDVMTAAFARSLIPVIRTRHVSQPIKNKLHRRLQWRYGSDHVIATADCIRQEVLAKGLAPDGKISVIGEWAADGFFDLSKKTAHREDVRREFNVPEDQPMVCVVGMLRGDKAQEVLIQTVAELRRRGRDVAVLIVGEDTNSQRDYHRGLEAQAAELGVTDLIRFTGYRDDVARLTQASDSQVITSISVEAQSRTAPQAFASQTPIVASRVGGVAELIAPGRTGWLVEIQDVSGYADALTEIFDNKDESARITAEARAFAEANLRMDRKMAETLKVYERLIAARRTS